MIILTGMKPDIKEESGFFLIRFKNSKGKAESIVTTTKPPKIKNKSFKKIFTCEQLMVFDDLEIDLLESVLDTVKETIPKDVSIDKENNIKELLITLTFKWYEVEI